MARDELLRLLADVAALPRQARAAGIGSVETCPQSCPPRRYVAWGAGVRCCGCGGVVLPAATLHAQLVAAVRRLRVSPWERRAA